MGRPSGLLAKPEAPRFESFRRPEVMRGQSGGDRRSRTSAEQSAGVLFVVRSPSPVTAWIATPVAVLAGDRALDRRGRTNSPQWSRFLHSLHAGRSETIRGGQREATRPSSGTECGSFVVPRTSRQPSCLLNGERRSKCRGWFDSGPPPPEAGSGTRSARWSSVRSVRASPKPVPPKLRWPRPRGP